MAGRLPAGPTLIYDDDHYYMGSVIAEHLRAMDIPVTLVTPESMVSAWGNHTSEQALIHRRMLEAGVELITAYGLSAFDRETAQIECIYSGNRKSIDVEAVVTVTMRSPDDALFRELQQHIDSGTGYQTLSCPASGTAKRLRSLPARCLPVTATRANSTPRWIPTIASSTTGCSSKTSDPDIDPGYPFAYQPLST